VSACDFSSCSNPLFASIDNVSKINGPGDSTPDAETRTTSAANSVGLIYCIGSILEIRQKLDCCYYCSVSINSLTSYL
jgi:hypothetical protein